MSDIVKINDEVVTVEQFITYLKLSRKYEEILQQLVREKVTVHAAKKLQIEVDDDEIQAAAITFIKSLGMRRAREAYDWLEELGVSMEDFEEYLSEKLYGKKMREAITDGYAVEEYFKLNSPSFDLIDMKIITVEGEGKAREISASLFDDPGMIDMLVERYSIDETTRENGGLLMGINRSELPGEVSAKAFNAKPGDVLGPFRIGRSTKYQVILVLEIHTAVLDDSIRDKISDTIFNEWLNARFREHRIGI